MRQAFDEQIETLFANALARVVPKPFMRECEAIHRQCRCALRFQGSRQRVGYLEYETLDPKARRFRRQRWILSTSHHFRSHPGRGDYPFTLSCLFLLSGLLVVARNDETGSFLRRHCHWYQPCGRQQDGRGTDCHRCGGVSSVLWLRCKVSGSPNPFGAAPFPEAHDPRGARPRRQCGFHFRLRRGARWRIRWYGLARCEKRQHRERQAPQHRPNSHINSFLERARKKCLAHFLFIVIERIRSIRLVTLSHCRPPWVRDQYPSNLGSSFFGF